MGALRIWLMAARPRTHPAALAPVLVGSAAAWAWLDGDGFRWGNFFAALIGAIEQGAATPPDGHRDAAALRTRLARGVAGTRRIPGKHGAPSVAYRQVVIEIPDAPGALARLFADVDRAGVNVEDVTIDHDQNRQVADRMPAQGWDVQP